MDNLHIGVTTPLLADQHLASNMEAASHVRLLESLDVSSIVLHNELNAKEIIDRYDLHGIVFTGGGDISAKLYGGNELLAVDRLNPKRDVFERELIEEAFARHVPVLGVCRGMQLANVFFGGTLIEDLPTFYGDQYLVRHSQFRENGSTAGYAHVIHPEPDTFVFEETGGLPLQVNSFHHQAIGILAPQFRIAARAEDGTIEAMEFADPDRGFFRGVQWHPEMFPNDAFTRSLYRALIRAASGAHV